MIMLSRRKPMPPNEFRISRFEFRLSIFHFPFTIFFALHV